MAALGRAAQEKTPPLDRLTGQRPHRVTVSVRPSSGPPTTMKVRRPETRLLPYRGSRSDHVCQGASLTISVGVNLKADPLPALPLLCHPLSEPG